MAKPFEDVYIVHGRVRCKKCGHVGAVEYYGRYFPQGLDLEGKDPVIKEIYGKEAKGPYMSGAIGFGGTIPMQCTNCGNTGLSRFALEGYEVTFEELEGE